MATKQPRNQLKFIQHEVASHGGVAGIYGSGAIASESEQRPPTDANPVRQHYRLAIEGDAGGSPGYPSSKNVGD